MPTLTPFMMKVAVDYAVSKGVAPDQAVLCVAEVAGCVRLAEVEKIAQSRRPRARGLLMRANRVPNPIIPEGLLNKALMTIAAGAGVGATGAIGYNWLRGNPLTEGLAPAMAGGSILGAVSPFLPKLVDSLT